MKRRNWLFGAAVVFAVGGINGEAIDQAQAGLVYWQNFDGDGITGDGIADITPGGGNLGLATEGANGNASYSASGGVFGGRLNANGGTATSATSLAATSIAPGNAISNLGSMSKFTISFWINIESFRTGSLNNTHARALVAGDPANAIDILVGAGGLNTVGIGVRNNTTGLTNPRALDIVVNGSTARPLSSGNFTGISGTSITAGTWTFVALTYDGTSDFANDSADQFAATGGASMVNGQVYFGTTVTSVARFDAPFNNDFTAHGDATKPSAGPVNFTAMASLFLANNSVATRGIDGFLDDVRIYNELLSATDVELVRLQGIQGVPEPASIALMSVGLVGFSLLKRRVR